MPHFGLPCSRAPVLAQCVMRMKIAISHGHVNVFDRESFLKGKQPGLRKRFPEVRFTLKGLT
jgi:hypothetical protein